MALDLFDVGSFGAPMTSYQFAKDRIIAASWLHFTHHISTAGGGSRQMNRCMVLKDEITKITGPQSTLAFLVAFQFIFARTYHLQFETFLLKPFQKPSVTVTWVCFCCPRFFLGVFLEMVGNRTQATSALR